MNSKMRGGRRAGAGRPPKQIEAIWRDGRYRRSDYGQRLCERFGITDLAMAERWACEAWGGKLPGSWGGRRPGAGRPRIYLDNTERRGVAVRRARERRIKERRALLDATGRSTAGRWASA